MKNIVRFRRGFILPLVLLATIILAIMVYFFNQYRRQQVQMSSTLGNFYNALNVAEAGLNAAVTEMLVQFDFKTHLTDGQPGATNFSQNVAREIIVKSGGELKSIADTDMGTYRGQFGDYGEFKVRVGLEQVAGDNPDTKTVNEKFMFYRIESIGRYGDNYQKVTTILKRRILCEEFLMFDNEFVELVKGVPGGIAEENVLEIGSIYGKNYVFLGTIPGNRPRLVIKNISEISTAGEIYVWDDYVKIDSLNLRPNLHSSTTNFHLLRNGLINPIGSPAFSGERVIPGEVNEDFAANSAGVLKDVRNGGAVMEFEWEELFTSFAVKARTNGIFIDSISQGIGYSDSNFRNPYPDADHTPILHIDFGSFNDGDENLGSQAQSSGYNGIIYSSVPLRIRGNPDRDTVIVSDQDIYVCGDINQSEQVLQNYQDSNMLRYSPNPLTGQDYFEEDKQFRVDNPSKKQGLYRNRLKIISRRKIWYDYTRPDFIYRNELIPLIEFELAKILTDENRAYEMMKDLTADTDLTTTNPDHLINRLKAAADSGADEAGILSIPELSAVYDYLMARPSGGRTQFDAEPRTEGIYCSVFGNSSAEAVDFLKQKINYSEGALSKRESFAEMVSNGSLSPDQRTALATFWFQTISDSVEIDGEESSIWDMPQRLFDLVKPGGVYSQFNNPGGRGAECQRDKLMIPEMTLNAKFISSDVRNGTWLHGKTTSRIRNELGNPRPDWSPPRTGSYSYFRYIQPASAVFRIMGGEIFLRLEKFPPEMVGSVYQPGVRKKVFDIDLMGFEDENAIPVFSIISYDYDKSDKDEFESF